MIVGLSLAASYPSKISHMAVLKQTPFLSKNQITGQLHSYPLNKRVFLWT
jgi:hypothetical protein